MEGVQQFEYIYIYIYIAWGFYPEAWANMILRIVQSHLARWFPKCDPRVPKDPQPLPRGSVGTSVVATLNFTYFFN